MALTPYFRMDMMIEDKASPSEMDHSDVTTKLIHIILQMPPDERRMLYEDLRGRYDQKRREHSRRDYFMIAECLVADQLHKGYIKNISPVGLFIELNPSKQIEPGSKITLTFSHPDSTGHVKTTGKIVRVEDKGIGVQLDNLIPLFSE